MQVVVEIDGALRRDMAAIRTYTPGAEAWPDELVLQRAVRIAARKLKWDALERLIEDGEDQPKPCGDAK